MAQKEALEAEKFEPVELGDLETEVKALADHQSIDNDLRGDRNELKGKLADVGAEEKSLYDENIRLLRDLKEVMSQKECIMVELNGVICGLKEKYDFDSALRELKERKAGCEDTGRALDSGVQDLLNEVGAFRN